MDLATFADLKSETRILISVFCFLCPLIITVLIQMLRKMINDQIDEQMKKMIPLKGVRKLIVVEMKWR